MALIAGYALFFVEEILPLVALRDSMLGVSRMSVNWDVEDVVKHLDRLGRPYDAQVADRLRARGGGYTSAELFPLLGFRHYEDIDFDASEGASIVHDLNTPLPTTLHDRFDFVFENGTIEHVFDIRQAIANIAHAVRTGGHVCHASPLDAFNHGFYNLSINFFNDFYTANGFDELRFWLVRYAADWRRNPHVRAQALEYTHKEFQVDAALHAGPLNKLYICCLAHKAEHVVHTRTPVQAAYDRAKGLSSRLNRW